MALQSAQASLLKVTLTSFGASASPSLPPSPPSTLLSRRPARLALGGGGLSPSSGSASQPFTGQARGSRGLRARSKAPAQRASTRNRRRTPAVPQPERDAHSRPWPAWTGGSSGDAVNHAGRHGIVSRRHARSHKAAQARADHLFFAGLAGGARASDPPSGLPAQNAQPF